MDVKEVQAVKFNTGKSVTQSKTSPLQRSLSSLSTEKVDVARTEAVNVAVQENAKDPSVASARKKANSVINALNVVSEATEDIGRMVESIAGIAEQAEGDSISGSRLQVLEQEAAELVSAIKNRASTEALDGKQPLSGDPIRLEVEENLGKTLEVILPEDTRVAFGLEQISLSPRENIIRTRASIEEARSRLEALRTAVDSTIGEVQELVSAIDVAVQNAEASQASIRDVDQALSLTSELRKDIGENPKEALQANNFGDNSLDLLE